MEQFSQDLVSDTPSHSQDLLATVGSESEKMGTGGKTAAEKAIPRRSLVLASRRGREQAIPERSSSAPSERGGGLEQLSVASPENSSAESDGLGEREVGGPDQVDRDRSHYASMEVEEGGDPAGDLSREGGRRRRRRVVVGRRGGGCAQR